MDNKRVGVAFVAVLFGIAWLARPEIPDAAALGWYVAGWISIAAGATAMWSGRLPPRKRVYFLVALGSLLLADVCWSQPRLADLQSIVLAAVAIGVIAWRGLYLRDRRLRALVPLAAD